MSFTSDLKVLYHLIFTRGHGENLAERMDDFYSKQVDEYDNFRARLLLGRTEMMQRVPAEEGAVWVDLGGGTGANIEVLGDRIASMKKIYIVDIATSLLEVAEKRVKARGWTNVEIRNENALTFTPDEGYADVVTMSYSPTMIPDWFLAFDNAFRILKPGGVIGIVDWYVSRKWDNGDRKRHNWFTRNYWPVHFSTDNVFISPDHIPYLLHYFEQVSLEERRSKVPYVPFIRVPIYIFIGRKPL